MNDAAVREIWDRLTKLERSVNSLARAVTILEGRIRARLKEEADERKLRSRGTACDCGRHPHLATCALVNVLGP